MAGWRSHARRPQASWDWLTASMPAAHAADSRLDRMVELPPFRSGLFAVCGSADESSGVGASQLCAELFGRSPDVEVGGSGHRLSFCIEGEATYATDATERVTVVLHGDITGLGEDPARSLAERVASRGVDVVRGLDGRFAILVHDAALQQTWAITDRANGRWLFHASSDGFHVITTELAAQPTDRFTLDPVGIGWALSAGMAVRGRTLYEGIRILEGGSTHLLKPRGIESRPYWSYEIEDRTSGRSHRDLEDDLYGLLVEAVRRCVDDGSEPILSLSVGYDLTAVAGVLIRELGHEAVQSFTYARGEPAAGSDALSARHLTDLLGLRYRVVESYDGDFVSHVRRNALLGGGLGNPCEEVDAWFRLGADLATRPKAVVLTGDQRFGGKAIEFGGVDDVLRILGLRPLQLPPHLSRRLPSQTLSKIRQGQLWDRQAVLDSSPAFDNLNDLHDHIRWTQRLPHRIMPWRERFAGRFVTVRGPWLDAEVVDFVAGLPTELRLGKRLYKQTVARRFPDLFGFPRATVGGYELDLATELRRASSRIGATLLTGDSRLDELIPPEALRELFLAAGGRPSRLGEIGKTAFFPVQRVAERMRRKAGLEATVLSRRALQLLFRRAVVLREALR